MSLIATLEADLEEMYRDPRTERDQAQFDNFVRSLRRYEEECDRMATFKTTKPPPPPKPAPGQEPPDPNAIANLREQFAQIAQFNDTARVLIERLGRGLDKIAQGELFLTNEEERTLRDHWDRLHQQLAQIEEQRWQYCLWTESCHHKLNDAEKDAVRDDAEAHGGALWLFTERWPRAEYARLLERAATARVTVTPLPRRSVIKP